MSTNIRDLVATAAAWLVKTESPTCTPEQRQSFQQWVDADITHRAAVAIASTAHERTVRSRSNAPQDKRSGHSRLFTLVTTGVACICAAGWYADDQLAWEDYSTHVGGK